MSGLTGYKIFVANFYNKSGEWVASKRIKGTFSSLSGETFDYAGGTYLIDTNVSRSRLTPFPWLFDYFSFSYTLNNPTPLTQNAYHYNPFNARRFNVLLKSDILEKLNNVRKGGLGQFLTPANIIIALMIIGGIVYFSSGGSLTQPTPIEPIPLP